MHSGQSVLLSCLIGRSGFSGERVIRLPLADQTEFVGVAPVDYCRHPDQTPLGDEPARGHRIPGLVEAQVVANGGTTVQVIMPGSETIRIQSQQVAFVRQKETNYVPLGS